MIISKVEQNSPEWLALKLGVPSSSHFSEIITSTGALSKQHTKYMNRLAGERVSGTGEETFSSKHTDKGLEREPEARSLYEIITGVDVELVGVCYQDTKKRYLCSPDGLVGKPGGLEIKCPMMTTQVEYLRANAIPAIYFQQIQGSLLITGRKWWDFMSYYPGIKPLIIRVTRDEPFIRMLYSRLDTFCVELADVTKQIGG